MAFFICAISISARIFPLCNAIVKLKLIVSFFESSSIRTSALAVKFVFLPNILSIAEFIGVEPPPGSCA